MSGGLDRDGVEVRGQKGGMTKEHRETFGGDEYVHDLIMMMVSQVCVYVKIYQII